MTDFDRIFEPSFRATEVFVNRFAEHTTFRSAIRHHLERFHAGAATLDRTARHNVLTFFGIGGIGKTALSKRLERWLLGELEEPGDWGELPPFEDIPRTCRFDFHGSRAVNAIDIVLGLRAAVADTGHRFPAFDLGMSAWWAFGRPGTPLPDVRNARGFDVRGQISDTLNSVLDEAGARLGLGPLTVRSGMLLVDAVRERRLRNRTLRDCAPLVAIADEARLDPSAYVAATLAGLLSWDLENIPTEERPLLVAFADAFEYVQGNERSQERLFNRIVHLTPGVLWVVTSRNRLSWASVDFTGLLPATGPGIWPGLAMDARTEPRQHLVGDLSDADVTRFLMMATSRSEHAELSPEVLEAIRRGSHGLPLYLDLALEVARTSSRHSSPAAFAAPLPDLVTRVFANLPGGQRELARTASLLPRFDAELLAEATDALVGDAYRLCQQTLVTSDAHPLFPLRLHDAVRAAIAHEPIVNEGAWAPADRKARASRLVMALKKRHANVLHDIDRRLDVLEIALTLCAEHDLEESWLTSALLNNPGFERIADRLPPPGPDNWAGKLSGIFEGWRHGWTLRQRLSYLEEYATRPLPEDLQRAVRRRLAYGYRTAQDHESSLRILADLLQENPDSELYRYQVALGLRNIGDYEGLRRHLVRYPLGEPTAQLRVNSDLAYDRGELTEAAAGPAARASYLRTIGLHRTALENDCTALWRGALIGRTDPADCDLTFMEADRYGVRLNMRTALAAKSVSIADDPQASRAVLTEAMAVVNASSGTPGWREWSSGMIHGLRYGDQELVRRIHHVWSASRHPWSPDHQIIDRLSVFAGFPARYPPLRLSGSDDSTEIDRRWHAAIQCLVTRT